jgi:hypothetical protein
MNRRTFVTSTIAGFMGTVGTALAEHHAHCHCGHCGHHAPLPGVVHRGIFLPDVRVELRNVPLQTETRWRQIRSLAAGINLGIHLETGLLTAMNPRHCIPGSQTWEVFHGTFYPAHPFNTWISLRNAGTGKFLTVTNPTPDTWALTAEGHPVDDAISFRTMVVPGGGRLLEHAGAFLSHHSGDVKLVGAPAFPHPPAEATPFMFE